MVFMCQKIIFETLEEAEEYVSHPRFKHDKLIIVRKPYGMIRHHRDDDYKYYSIDDERYEEEQFLRPRTLRL